MVQLNGDAQLKDIEVMKQYYGKEVFGSVIIVGKKITDGLIIFDYHAKTESEIKIEVD